MDKYFKKLTLTKFFIYLVISLVSYFAISFGVSYIFGRYLSDNAFLRRNYTGILTIITSGILYALMMLFIYKIGLTDFDRKKIFEQAPSRSKGNILFVLVPFGIGTLFNVLLMSILMQIPGFMDLMTKYGTTSQNLARGKGVLNVILMYVVVVILAPIFEEIIFRGVLFNLLNKKKGFVFALIVSSLVFGSLHGITILQTFLIGMMLALVYQITGNLKYSIAAHAFNNFVSLTLGYLMSNIVAMAIAGVLLIALFIASVILLFKYLNKNPLGEIVKDYTPIYKADVLNGEIPMINFVSYSSMYSNPYMPSQPFMHNQTNQFNAYNGYDNRQNKNISQPNSNDEVR